ncbi:MAG: exopolysaccharide biosynthesis polyprenyl glycosylphosphotransferase [Lachnospiraceae bacterium]|nr:exopolysaccharide biosynthesis polyprenyl glycosylphosphotransferase [Lachnospiraceae bacterium]MCI1328792.1 exopolysaccharide biosynthesis polyprenyl glycosylphosphotransferase [Lachnospiraceae bacterium]
MQTKKNSQASPRTRRDSRLTKRHYMELRFIKMLNPILMTVPFAVLWFLYYSSRVNSPFYVKGNWLVIVLYLLLFSLYGRTYDAFLVSYNQVSEMIYSQMLAALITNFLTGIVIWLLCRYLRYVWMILSILPFQLLVSILWSNIAHRWYYHMFAARKTIIVWDMRRDMRQMIRQYRLDRKFDVIMELPTKKCLSCLSVLDPADAVFLAGVHSRDRNKIIKYCVEKKITVFVIPRIGDVLMSSARHVHMFHIPMLRLDRYNPPPEYLFFKRLFDILFSLILIVILSPLMLVTAILIRRDGGPVFYRQDRLTRDGKVFRILKFRSMRVDAEKDGVARLSTGENDDRITPTGRVIRSTRIDELPQLFNILGGSMSFVGPRPERPEIAKEYEKTLPEFNLRLQAKAGLTGLAQVYGKYNTEPYDKLQMDLMYIANPGIAQDIRLVFATIKILFMKESTEGVAEGQTTALTSPEPPEEADRLKWTETTDALEKTERTERTGAPEKTERTERTDAPEKTDQTERTDDAPEKTEETER